MSKEKSKDKPIKKHIEESDEEDEEDDDDLDDDVSDDNESVDSKNTDESKNSDDAVEEDDESKEDEEEDEVEEEVEEEEEEEEDDDGDDDDKPKKSSKKKNAVKKDNIEFDIDDYDDILDEEGEPIIVPPEEHITANHLYFYETVRIIGERAQQISSNSKPFIKNVEGKTPIEIAILELYAKMNPYIIVRKTPGNKIEKKKVRDLEIIHPIPVDLYK